jgi:hypothetical protein
MGGQAIDVTIVTTAGRTRGSAADLAERRKIEKYKTELEKHPGLAFAPMGFDLDGGVGKSAWAQMQMWARWQARNPRSMRDYTHSLRFVIGTIARAFVLGIVRHIRSFEAYQADGTPRGAWADARRR